MALGRHFGTDNIDSEYFLLQPKRDEKEFLML